MSFWRRVVAFTLAVLEDLCASLRAICRLTAVDFLVLAVTTFTLTVQLSAAGFEAAGAGMAGMMMFFCVMDFTMGSHDGR